MSKKCKCSFPGGITIKPDGENELDPCWYVPTERHYNVTVEVSYCKYCGAANIDWKRTEDTVDELIEIEEQEE